jgi:hypothetical protein
MIFSRRTSRTRDPIRFLGEDGSWFENWRGYFKDHESEDWSIVHKFWFLMTEKTILWQEEVSRSEHPSQGRALFYIIPICQTINFPNDSVDSKSQVFNKSNNLSLQGSIWN